MLPNSLHQDNFHPMVTNRLMAPLAVNPPR